ncbi:PREDICTED: RCC1 domain-containing protein 1 [Myotis brandtii]|uniref:RCC1 domain-containing protein 1 n=1 Tax=Myotis brandtii TaxID=109478 RepID=UPI0007045A87|nr:PREDICTED: RCC1 domain-containing protein 1 [Myotis brandtii]
MTCGSQWTRARREDAGETGDIYIWGWNESGQLALPTRGLAEDRETVAGEEATALREDGSEVKGPAGTEDGAAAPFIAVQPFPALLDLPLGSDAVTASCGSRHTAVVTRTGELYTWGWGHPRLLTRTVAETPEHKQVSGRLLHRQIKGRC